jgi:hypothetical protein
MRELPAGLAFAFFAGAAVASFMPGEDRPWIVGGLVVLGIVALIVWAFRFCTMRTNFVRQDTTGTGHGVS